MKKIVCLILALVMTCSMATVAFAADENDKQTVQEDVRKEFTIYTAKEGETASTATNEWKIDVQANENVVAVTNSQVKANYYVIVEWEVDSTLTYVIDEESYTWNVWAEDGTTAADATNEAGKAGYTSDGGTWVGDASVVVNVTNWSNKAVNAEISFAASAKDEDKNITEAITANYTVTCGDDKSENAEYTMEIASPAGNADATVTTAVYDSGVTGTATVAINVTDGAINADNVTIGQVTVKLTDDMGQYIQQDTTPTT